MASAERIAKIEPSRIWTITCTVVNCRRVLPRRTNFVYDAPACDSRKGSGDHQKSRNSEAAVKVTKGNAQRRKEILHSSYANGTLLPLCNKWWMP